MPDFYKIDGGIMKNYDIIAVGAGAAGAFLAYELTKLETKKKVLIIDGGRRVENRTCPITDGKVDHCIGCKPCNIMYGFGGAGTLSDGKYNITTNFGGDLHRYVGEKKAMELMEYVDSVLMSFDGGDDLELYSTDKNDLKTKCLRHDLHLLDAKVRHFGTDRNKIILHRMYEYVKDKIDFEFSTMVEDVDYENGKYIVKTDKGGEFSADDLVLAAGRSGSKWIGDVCDKFGIKSKRNRVDIGLRIEVPAEVFKHITDDVYEAKIMYQTKQYNDIVRTFCMNPYGHVVTENTNGILTVNGHSFTDPKLQSENTNFALLVTNRFTEPFEDSNEYGESIARLSNMLGGGVLMQRFGDLVKGRRSSDRRMEKSFTKPTMKATPGDLSLVMPKRQLDDIIEMIYQLDKIAPGMANDDTLLYGIEVKFYNSEIEVDEKFESKHKGLYCVGDGSGATHSLSQASACGIEVARILA
ncbi:pyridine nucleotide-disulfide oxidoreductase [Anaerococcus lactolyticus ATCC 51172]|uniref:Pyridine nucleotide-disulfide oxidoreductase n=2 Tax=Anaerococcus lactolyticus TaxID=33032 RepID=C2BEE6_9FIRM|nr:pyridine nucleotide-disulfide oxidoreductase [Anaerococcus lactolyticus ATCC 51172]